MKIRMGHVSNSSSTSFSIPSFLLTDEQKEMLLSLDSMREMKEQLQEKLAIENGENWEDSANDYPRDEGYHLTYQDMVEAGKWDDLPWEIGEDKKYKTISGSTGMWNGTIEKFMERIGIDPTMIEITNHGHLMVHMATHPEAVKHNIWLHQKWMENWEKFSKEKRNMEIGFGQAPPSETPYAMSDDRFKPFGDNALEYEQEAEDDFQDTYCYIKDKKSED